MSRPILWYVPDLFFLTVNFMVAVVKVSVGKSKKQQIIIDSFIFVNLVINYIKNIWFNVIQGIRKIHFLYVSRPVQSRKSIKRCIHRGKVSLDEKPKRQQWWNCIFVILATFRCRYRSRVNIKYCNFLIKPYKF